MTDYGRPVEFGYFPIPNADDYPQLVALARSADELGIDLIGVQDHPYQRRFLDTFSLLAALAVQTKRIRLFPDVANLPLRPPAVLAKAAASIDLMSGGRFELGMGAGAFWDAVWAMGGPRREPRQAVDALEEAIAVVRMLWSGDRGLRYDGDHYALRGVHSGPVPAHRIGIWLGAVGPRMLRLTGRVADGWVPSSSHLPPEQLASRHALIDDAAVEAARDPADVRRLYNVSGRITDGPTEGLLRGPASQWIEELTRLVVEEGMDTFVFWPDGPPEAQLRAFAELADDVRNEVAKARS
jgi:alkanesulfonate monooxygenase SsuD/methylene tetrahydromethanopterin reductase-like flavin-dependent oxidoreductase (luciferase family)